MSALEYKEAAVFEHCVRFRRQEFINSNQEKYKDFLNDLEQACSTLMQRDPSVTHARIFANLYVSNVVSFADALTRS